MKDTVTLKCITVALGKNRSTVLRRAKKECWQFDTVTVRGGEQRHYHRASLPDDVRSALTRLEARDGESRQQGEQLATVVKHSASEQATERRQQRELGLKRFAALPESHPRRLRAQARELVLRCLWEMKRFRGLDWRTAFDTCAMLVNTGEMSLPEWAWEWMPKRCGTRNLTADTLRRWHYAYQREGIWALVDGYGSRKGDFKVSQLPELEQIVVGCLVKEPHITAKKIKAYLEAAHPSLDIVSEKGLQRFIKQWKKDNAQAYTYVTNPDLWKNQYMAAHGSHHEYIQRINQLWELDSTPADWMLADGRHSVVGSIDMKSRRLRFLVSKTSTAAAIGLVFRRCVLDWGLPEAVRTDNGKDYVSQSFRTVLADTEVEHLVCRPFASEEKGTIERAMRTMSHGILDLLPGFIGHNVAERKVIEARKSFADRIMTRGETVELALTAEQLQEKLDQWIDAIYMHDEHAGLKATPFEVVSNSRDPVRRISDERALDILLTEIAGERTVTKKGIKLDHYFYTAPELTIYVGERVFLRRDPNELGRVLVYGVEGEFICLAVCHEILGISRTEAANAAKHFQKRLVTQQRAELQASARAIKGNIAEHVLAHRMEKARNLTAFPAPSQEYSTPALEQHGLAARASDAHAPSSRDAHTDDAVARLQAEMAQTTAPATVSQINDPMNEFAHWCRLNKRQTEGGYLSESEQRFWKSYRRTQQFEQMKQYFEDFQLDALEYGA